MSLTVKAGKVGMVENVNRNERADGLIYFLLGRIPKSLRMIIRKKMFCKAQNGS